jgi:putative transposase
VAQRRAAVEHARTFAALSERTACRYVQVPRSSVRYRSCRAPRTAERDRLNTLASEKTRWGYRFLHTVLRREGFTLNHKVTYRLYREERLGLRRRGRRRRRSTAPRQAMPVPTAVNDRWSIDFVSDSLMNGRRFRALTIVDDHSRECPAIEVDTSLPTERVIEVLERVGRTRGFPKAIVTDNGPEFISRAFDQWAYARGVQIIHIEPGKPVQNAFIESFNGTFREECLNQHWFVHLRDARNTIEAYRIEYNTVRPHSALGYRTPEENQKLLNVASAPGGAPAFEHSPDRMKGSNITKKKSSPQPAGLT